MFRWSLISISSPGRIARSRLPAALVCTSTVTPQAASVRDRALHHRGIAAFVGVLAAGEHRDLVGADLAEQQLAGVAGDAEHAGTRAAARTAA